MLSSGLVELDSNNLDARDDLLSFYLEAPGFLGGGKTRHWYLWSKSSLRTRANSIFS